MSSGPVAPLGAFRTGLPGGRGSLPTLEALASPRPRAGERLLSSLAKEFKEGMKLFSKLVYFPFCSIEGPLWLWVELCPPNPYAEVLVSLVPRSRTAFLDRAFKGTSGKMPSSEPKCKRTGAFLRRAQVTDTPRGRSPWRRMGSSQQAVGAPRKKLCLPAPGSPDSWPPDMVRKEISIARVRLVLSWAGLTVPGAGGFKPSSPYPFSSYEVKFERGSTWPASLCFVGRLS